MWNEILYTLQIGIDGFIVGGLACYVWQNWGTLNKASTTIIADVKAL